jgi:hypothetical protein
MRLRGFSGMLGIMPALKMHWRLGNWLMLPIYSRWNIYCLTHTQALALRHREDPNQPPMPIIVGSPRSGTTLLRFMMDAHAELAIPPETGFLITVSVLPGSSHLVRHLFFARVTHYPQTGASMGRFSSRERLFGSASWQSNRLIRQVELRWSKDGEPTRAILCDLP